MFTLRCECNGKSFVPRTDCHTNVVALGYVDFLREALKEQRWPTFYSQWSYGSTVFFCLFVLNISMV